MNSGVKRAIGAVLVPLALAADALGAPLARAWAWARLRARLGDGVDPSVVALGTPQMPGTGQVRLGRDLYLYPGLVLETQGAGTIEIGDRAVLSQGVHVVSHASVRIGAGAMIGEYASIRDANHRYGAGIATRDSGHDARPVSIGAHAWIGRGATVLPGVTIGDHAVVGANAVVTRDVAPGVVVAGVPARPIASARSARALNTHAGRAQPCSVTG
jgi:acetyltransferase-like isoleucine patch superfamily enzyme